MNDKQTPEPELPMLNATGTEAGAQLAMIQDTSEESEPFLGIWWTILMIVIYLLKELAAPEPYTVIWFIEMYILFLVVFVTLFTVYKRLVYFRRLKQKTANAKSNS